MWQSEGGFTALRSCLMRGDVGACCVQLVLCPLTKICIHASCVILVEVFHAALFTQLLFRARKVRLSR